MAVAEIKPHYTNGHESLGAFQILVLCNLKFSEISVPLHCMLDIKMQLSKVTGLLQYFTEWAGG